MNGGAAKTAPAVTNLLSHKEALAMLAATRGPVKDFKGNSMLILTQAIATALVASFCHYIITNGR